MLTTVVRYLFLPINHNIKNMDTGTHSIIQLRWVSTGIYLLSCLSASMMVQSCTPIVEELSMTYNVSTTLVKISALIFMVTHPVFTMLSNWLVESLGLKFSVLCNIYMSSMYQVLY